MRAIPKTAGRLTSARSIPATHTTLRLVLELDGERIVHCTPHIGYLHSGFEKLGEHLNYNQYVTIVDRMDYSAPIYNELAWHLAIEKLMGIESDAALQGAADHRRRTGPHSVAPAVHRGARGWIWARSPRSSTASTSANASTTSSSSCPASDSTPVGRG